MSRLIVKNLPSGIKEDRVRKLFEERGHVTECCLKYAKDGRFRKFAFIGYKLPEQAKAAVNFLNKSFIDTSQIQVEICKDLCDPEKPRAWSKHSRESSAYQKLMASNKEKEEEKQMKDKADKKEKLKKKQQNKEKNMGEMLGELKDDEHFHEFLEIHKSRVNKATWSNDTVFPQEVASEEDDETGHQKEEESDDNTDDSISASDSDSPEDKVDEEIKHKAASKKDLSDLEYLRSKMSSKKKLLSDADSESGSDTSDGSSESDSESDSESEDSDEESSRETATITEGDSQNKNKDHKDSLEQLIDIEDSECLVKYIIKLRGIPANAKEKQVGEFFRPLKIKNVKIPRNAKGKKSFSTASVEFYTEIDQDQGMRRNKNFMGSKRIYLHKVKVKETVATTEEKPKPWEIKLAQHKGEAEEEGIAESGRLYVRNLAYCCTEEDIEEQFGQFGPLTEVHVPIDRFTKKMKGFAFVTFMMPEHAVKAYTQLDGSVFQGRMLHILPGRMKKEDGDTEEKSSFKKKKDAKDKASASSSHNWNALFLGANAVADAMADKYRTSKSAILDAESGQSLGVRMALGETQLVAETREFLLENGVQLDSFSQPAAARSKTVILVKNLPAATTGEEIEKVFSRYGTVGRVVLPPSGITAVVEYLEPSEARNGFQNLAYSKFQHVPLYLEWAPVGVFKPTPAAAETEPKDEPGKSGQKRQEDDIESESEDEAEPDTTLFVKNLNFDTTEENLTELFKKVGELACVAISKKKDMKNSGHLLSMGYGFIQFKKRESAQKAMRDMQHCMLDGHQLILKVSNRATVSQPGHATRKKQDTKKKAKSSKILIRNVPFEAKVNEIRQLFGTFGELKSVRLPKKLSGTGPHRGFGFVDFLTKHDAKRAFNALCHSTHLYGRRLVLEWADSEETVDQLRQKTASHFHEDPAPKRLKKSALLEDLKAMTE